MAQSLTIGSHNVAVADPTIPAPPTTPCVVPLYTNQSFDNPSGPTPINYTPPAACPGPWQKVVLSIDMSMLGTNQYDRTGSIWLGGAILYFGTTQEPSVAPPNATTWHIDRDVTDYSSVFTTAQSGHSDFVNYVEGQFDGKLSGSASLYFYPVAHRRDHDRGHDHLQPRPDVVLSMNANQANGTFALNTTTDQYTATYTALPRNIERAYLDVYAQSQSNDEIWYSCNPNDQGSLSFFGCNNTAFRETEISIDGQPAGVAPVYPWIYTGGTGNPWLWEPTPGVQTLSFVPYRVDLTPFAGMLDDGKTHTVSMSVFNANGYFSVAGNLLLYLDHGSKQVTGSLLTNTLSAAPTPKVVENLTTDANNNVTGGNITVTSKRSFTIAGVVNTSHGAVKTEVDQTVDFSNSQDYSLPANSEGENIVQNTTVDSTTTRSNGRWNEVVLHEHRSYPLKLDLGFFQQTDGTFQQYSDVKEQGFRQSVFLQPGFGMPTSASLDNTFKGNNTVLYTATQQFNGTTDTYSSQDYRYKDTFGECYNRKISSKDNALTGWVDGRGCWLGTNNLSWRDQFSRYASDAYGATVQLLP
ncbi:peptide-N4-asparagine amidase [Dyella mobilis]|uniref:Peptide-N(4)-(N-acetyl-beta-glucosaminyl)asparagine amidase n=1 Tax=Dyella mobilis TaxID=1849582 RepID=A0ABS2KEF6_9GAMM|nr:peptide-N4-asparagine amidase [Dyella mobilis]MBM7129479.1 peptide-N(4)-(N-acetyl-beta-glucosaminyl)asparagine amidase [Dyella mobilis]